MLDEKYVVIKRSDYDRGVMKPIEGGFFVIREQDVFGPAALFGYAHIIQTALEVSSLPGRQVFTEVEARELDELAHGMVQTAMMWQRTFKKVPD